ncbi:murein biosynthesis integral membrane protein MurJ [Candidatus Peregrinibacteria bacterium HGW-Peregrinibacteria-1]|jgi:putative peptidoglycan lipid II flippase|nr:MAG: murein biosynthesis integral membrane protein MurJ [Candidatus Peregrinibacteria bacterium HGW-Peregrinibacteria-1]
MISKIFKPATIGRATFFISATSLVSYILGFLRDRTIATTFGASNLSDAYYSASKIPEFLVNVFIAGALAAAFLPFFSQQITKDKQRAHELANTLLTVAGITIGIVATMTFIFAPQITSIAFKDSNPETRLAIIDMIRIMAPSALLFAISNTLGNILNSYRHFYAYSLSAIFYSLGIIVGVVLLKEHIGIYSAAVGALIGAFAHLTIRILDLHHTGYKYKPAWKIRNPDFIKILKLMAPKALSLASWQINLILFANYGQKIIEGGTTGFDLARNVQSAPVTLFAIAFATATYPLLSTAAMNKDKTHFTRTLQTTIQNILFYTIPAMVGLAILATPITYLIFAGGEFDQQAVITTSLILTFFAFSIPLEGVSHVLSRAYYAFNNTLTPTIFNVIGMTIIAACTIFIAPKYGIQWFSIGFTIGFLVYVTLLSIGLKNKTHNFQYANFMTSTMKTLAASMFMAGIILLIGKLTIHIEMQPRLITIIQVTLGGIAYFTMATLLKSPEIASLRLITNKVFKKQ